MHALDNMQRLSPVSFAVVLLVAWIASGTLSAADPPPNIVLMMADDMGMGDTSAYRRFTGNSLDEQLATPQMERLARMGVRFTDAHTSSTRCTGTRYGLLTGRYPWRSRLKHWVLFGVQGDPLIERGRPTIATLLRDAGYRTGMVGKWHVGLRYSKTDGSPAAGWADADLTKPMADTPLDHGFDFCRFTSRSHGTSGPDETHGKGKKKKKNTPTQTTGPGHVDGRTIVGATGNGKQLVGDGANAYRLSKLGSRHAANAREFIQQHITAGKTRQQPFFLYYACNSNHTPHTPDEKIGDAPVSGAAKMLSGRKAGKRGDFVYENDVALGYMLDYLAQNEDPRRPGKMLIENTIVIFTSDNGAEITASTATGPFRSNKGSVYEGGHRVPFIVAWPLGNVGDGDDKTVGSQSREMMALHDLFATFAAVTGSKLPDLRRGEIGAEDSRSVLAAWQGKTLPPQPLFMNDHKETEDDAAMSAIRVNDPQVGDAVAAGHWKLLLGPALLRQGMTVNRELYNLANDPRENVNRISADYQKELIAHLQNVALLHRNRGGHRYAAMETTAHLSFNWRVNHQQKIAGLTDVVLSDQFQKPDTPAVVVTHAEEGQAELKMTVAAVRGGKAVAGVFNADEEGLGVNSDDTGRVTGGDSLEISFSADVLIESISFIAGEGVCGGSVKVGQRSPLAIYCLDADNDANDQTGRMSDLGVLLAGQKLTITSAPHLGVENAGAWRMGSLNVSVLK